MARYVSYSISNEKSRALRALIAVEWMKEENYRKIRCTVHNRNKRKVVVVVVVVATLTTALRLLHSCGNQTLKITDRSC